MKFQMLLMKMMITSLPGICILWWHEQLGQGELVEVKNQQVSCTEDGQHHAQRAEDEHADGAAEHPPPHQSKKHWEVHSWGEGGKDDTCTPTNTHPANG